MKNETCTTKKNTHLLGKVSSITELERRVKLTGSHVLTDKLRIKITCKWHKINIKRLEANSSERNSKMEQLSKIYSFAFKSLLDTLMIL